jgi:NADH-quinone oxidoreductase subunit N
MFSLLGFPGTFGFIGKWAILSAVTAEHQQFLAVVLVLTSLVSAGYYLPVVRSMYMRAPLNHEIHDGVVLPAAARWAVAVSVVLLLVLGVLPRMAIDGTDRGAKSFSGTQLDRVVGGR